jgi:hypothetical protein
MKLPDGLTIDMIEAAARESMFGMDNTGFCLVCGAERDGCEPDAAGYECWECGEHAVMGAEQLYMMAV